MKPASRYAVSLLASSLALSAHAQTTTLASDNAGNYTSWPQSANNGTGFGNWSYQNSAPNGGYSGEFLGSSYTSNGGGINSGSGNAFGLYANGGASSLAQAVAPFSGGALSANQTFALQMQDHSITDNGGQEGFNLQDSSGDNILQFYFNGGASDYYLNIWTSIATGVQVDTGVGYTSGPLSLSYTQGTGGTWSFSIYEGATLENTLSSTSTGDLIWGNNISRVDLFSLNGGSARTMGDNDNLYFNNLQITSTTPVPEPGTMMLLGLSGLAVLSVLRRKA